MSYIFKDLSLSDELKTKLSTYVATNSIDENLVSKPKIGFSKEIKTLVNYEKRILNMLGEGKTTKEIAADFCMVTASINIRIKYLSKKFNLSKYHLRIIARYYKDQITFIDHRST